MSFVSLGNIYEGIVFETRDMPRLAPHSQWDLDITEVEGARLQRADLIQCLEHCRFISPKDANNIILFWS